LVDQYVADQSDVPAEPSTFSIFSAGLPFLGMADAVGALVSGNASSGLGDLTVNEVQQIQQAVDATGQPVTVIGSAANGTRNAASDIDYLFEQMPEFPSEMNDVDEIMEQLPDVDWSHGAIRGTFNPYLGSGISFAPGATPVVLPAAF
jgi:hypothetical protein